MQWLVEGRWEKEVYAPSVFDKVTSYTKIEKPVKKLNAYLIWREASFAPLLIHYLGSAPASHLSLCFHLTPNFNILYLILKCISLGKVYFRHLVNSH